MAKFEIFPRKTAYAKRDSTLGQSGLTDTRKTRRVHTDSVMSFIKVFVVAKAMMRDLRKDCTDWKTWRMVRHAFGKFVLLLRRLKMSSKLKKIYGLAAIVVLAIFVAACGGGGGGGSTPPPTTVTQTVTCPDGTSKTGTGTTASAALDAATAQCLAPTLVSITPADKATGVSPDTIATNGIVIATSSTLATPALSDITLKAGTTAVPVTVTMTAGGKGFKFVPNAKLLFAQAYTYVIGVTDTLGKKLSISGGFTTASVTCTAPLVPDSAGTSCVPPTCPTGTVWNGDICATTVVAWWPPATIEPMGTKVTGATVQITANVIGDASWQIDAKNGVIKFVDTGMVLTGYSAKPLVWAYYKGWDGTYCLKPVFKDDGLGLAPGPLSYTYGTCTTDPLTWVVGTKNGIIRYSAQKNKYFEVIWKWNPTLNGFEITDTETSNPF